MMSQCLQKCAGGRMRSDLRAVRPVFSHKGHCLLQAASTRSHLRAGDLGLADSTSAGHFDPRAWISAAAENAVAIEENRKNL